MKIIENERSMSHGRDGINVPQKWTDYCIGYPDAGGTELNKSGNTGRMAVKFLKENEPARYKTLYRFGMLEEKMGSGREANSLLVS